MRGPLPKVLAVVISLGAGLSARGQHGSPSVSGDFEGSIGLVGRPPLPLQPIRVRLVLSNASDRVLSVGRPEYQLWSQDSLQLRGSRESLPLRPVPSHSGERVMAETARQDFDTRLPLRVSPGNVTSTSLAFAGRWAGEGPAEIDVFEKPVFKSYFAAPGEYALSWHHVVKSGGPPDHRPIEVVSVATKITVEKPTGDDAVVFGLLSQN